MKKILFSLGLLFAAATSLAQELAVAPDSTFVTLMQMAPEDYSRIKLPPLQTLMENARTSPQMMFYEKGVEVQARELKNVRREWLSYFKISGNYNYGNSSLYSQYYLENGEPEIRGNNQAQNYWSLGGGVSVPLEALFNRRNKIQKQKRVMEQGQYEAERAFDELRMQIIELYSTVMQNLSSLQSVTDAMQFSKAQSRIVENDFLNGQTDARSVAQQKSMEASAIQAYEVIRNALNGALLKLEVLTNTPIVNPKPIGEIPAKNQ